MRARNFGGWGEFSDDSEYIVPLSQPLVPVAVDMQKAARKGMTYVLVSMQKNGKIAEAGGDGLRGAMMWHIRRRIRMASLHHRYEGM